MIYSDIIKYTFHPLHNTIQKNYFTITFLNKKNINNFKKISKKMMLQKNFFTIFKLFLLKLFKLSKTFLHVIKNKEIFKCFLSTKTSYI